MAAGEGPEKGMEFDNFHTGIGFFMRGGFWVYRENFTGIGFFMRGGFWVYRENFARAGGRLL